MNKRKNKILSDYNTIYYAANFRLRIYGRDKHEDNKITLRIEFKEKLPNCISHLLNEVNPVFLSEFFTEYKEVPERKIFLRCEIVEDNKIRNQVVKFQLRKLKNVTIEDIIKFVSSEKYDIENNPKEFKIFLEEEYNKEWNFYNKIYKDKKAIENLKKLKIIQKEEEDEKKKLILLSNKKLQEQEIKIKKKKEEQDIKILKKERKYQKNKIQLTTEEKIKKKEEFRKNRKEIEKNKRVNFILPYNDMIKKKEEFRKNRNRKVYKFMSRYEIDQLKMKFRENQKKR